MYLHSLELFGFKSFAPKTVMEFHRGVTCVVGPNGCGKSNVLDAIRWVLGEQSAKALRGGEMADVIFSGTDSRSALGMAEVTMNFAECEKELGVDWNEVAVTRRVFRDGSSEYLLNKTPCRLKDIHNLFMDTGIGRSAYSIMEQGKIDQILSSRPEDRRAIFEEAAGITRFKSQRKEALRKLEATEANLLRIDDVIKEVNRQIASMQRQAAKARRYQTLLSELKTFETHSSRQQWERMDDARRAGQEELDAQRARQSELEGEIEASESELAVRRSALAAMEEQLDAARRSASDLRTRISSHESRILFNSEKQAEFEGLSARYQGELLVAAEKLSAAESEILSVDAELREITAVLSEEQSQMEQAQAVNTAAAQERGVAERELQELLREMQREEQRVSGVRGQLSSLTQQRDGMEARLSVLGAEAESLRAEVDTLREQAAQAQAAHAAALECVERSAAELAAMEGELRVAQMGLATVEGELRQAQRAVSDKESRIEVLQALLESGEGFSSGTQTVLKGLDNPEFFLPSLQGALAAGMEVEPQYVAAVEAVLGVNLQSILLKDVQKAGHILKTLRAQKGGRVVLALQELDDAFDHVENPDLQLPEGALGWLLHKVKPLPGFERLVERLINFAVLVPDVDTALNLFPLRGWTLVTLEGDVLTGEGMLHGGVESGSGLSSILERRNQVQSLQTELEAARAHLAEKQTRREEIAAECQTLGARMNEAREQRQAAAVEQSTARAQLTQWERQLGETQRKLQQMEGEQSGAQARMAESAERLSSLEEEVNSAAAHVEGLQARRQELQGLLEALRAREAESSAELNELKVRVATERQRHSSLQQQRQPMDGRLTELRNLIEQRERDIEGYAGRMAAAAAESAEIEASLEGLRGRVGESEEVLQSLLAQRAAVAAEVEEGNAQARTWRAQLTALVDKRSRIEVQLSQVEMRIGAIEEHIRKRYQIELSEFSKDLYALKVAYRDAIKRPRGGAAAHSETDSQTPAAAPSEEAARDGEEHGEASAYELDWARLDAMVREIDQRIDAMGPVNMEAIQEYEELEQRHGFLQQQHADLINSKEELLQVIAKINNTTRQLFSETFEKVRTNFQEMFTELFGGGRANLVLTDESDPLESGIEIIAKPPGKQLQSITLLSGGEKTMTAVSLLFSIYMVKPSPFCVLDEMDAPLDESNINRFIRILDRFVGQSQFVVISHNKKTIARADALYGVTMEEHGVSRLVGVKFTRRDESRAGSDVTGESNASQVPSVAETFGKSPKLHSEETAAETA
jgi:chromosome segregation protein